MIVAGVCDSFLLECINGIHSETDVYKLALFTSAANLNPQTTKYLPASEIKAVGYEPGGIVLTGRVTGLADSMEGKVPDKSAWLNFASPTWIGSLTARGSLVYNSSKGNRAVVVSDFGDDIRSTNDVFTARFPPDGLTAVVVFS